MVVLSSVQSIKGAVNDVVLGLITDTLLVSHLSSNVIGTVSLHCPVDPSVVQKYIFKLTL